MTRTLVELARLPGLSELLLVQLADGALLDERTSPEQLASCLQRFSGERGIALARRRLARSRRRVRSPQETTLRLTLEDGGVEGLVPGYQLLGEYGEIFAEGDLVIPELLLWGEYDGFDVHVDRATFRRDRPRHRWVERRGWKVLRFADDDLRRGAAITAEWREAMAEAPARIRALDPRRSPEVAAAHRRLGFLA